MSATLLTPPLVEPVSLSEMKAFLKIDHNHEDDLLRAFITSARVHLEQLIGLHLISQTWRVLVEPPSEPVFTLPVAPIARLIGAATLSETGDLFALGPEALAIRQAKGPAQISMLESTSFNTGDRLQLDLETGFGATADDVPPPLRQAIKMITAEWYERRLIADPQSLPSLAKALAPLLSPYRAIRL